VICIGWLALTLAFFLACCLFLERQFHDAPDEPWPGAYG